MAQDTRGKHQGVVSETGNVSSQPTSSEEITAVSSVSALAPRDVRPKITCRERNPPIRMHQRSASAPHDRMHVRFNTSPVRARLTNQRRSLSEIGKSVAVDVEEAYKYRTPRSKSLDIELHEGESLPSSLHLHSHHSRVLEKVTSSSQHSLTSRLSLTKPIEWFRKRWLFHQLSDSGLLLNNQSINAIMHQDRKMSRSASVADVDLKHQLFRPVNELRRNKNQKQGPHPKKKMVRSHSESAIDLDVLRSVMKHSQTAPCDDDKPAGIIISNEDFKQILTDSKRNKFVRKRTNTMVVQLETTPEVPAEADVQLDNRLSEKEGSAPSPKELQKVLTERQDSNDRVTKLPMRQCVGSNPSSPVHLTESKQREHNMRLSPLMLHRNNVNSSNNRNSVHLSPKALASRLSSRSNANANCDELEPMLPKDKNGNPLIEENCFVDERMNESENENIPANIINENERSLPSSESAFDPQLLGEAIERHLAMQKQTSPSRRSPRCSEGRKRSGSLKSILGQNNSQISSRLGSLISRFPFKRDGSVSPTNSDSGVPL